MLPSEQVAVKENNFLLISCVSVLNDRVAVLHFLKSYLYISVWAVTIVRHVDQLLQSIVLRVGLHSGLLPSGFATKTLYAFSPHITSHATSHPH